jgi:hypothetical protein
VCEDLCEDRDLQEQQAGSLLTKFDSSTGDVLLFGRGRFQTVSIVLLQDIMQVLEATCARSSVALGGRVAADLA